MPWTGIGASSLGLAGGLMDVGLSYASSSYNYNQQKRMMARQFKYQKELLALQQGWSAKMSNTAHQREVADLRKAGLNPILSATGGQGATTPSVSAPAVGTGFSPGLDLGGTASGAVNAGVNAYTSAVNARKTNAEAKEQELKNLPFELLLTKDGGKRASALFGNAFDNIKEIYKKFGDTDVGKFLIEKFTGLPGKTVSAVTSAGNAVSNALSPVVQPIKDRVSAVSSSSNAVGSALGDFFYGPQKSNKTPDIATPAVKEYYKEWHASENDVVRRAKAMHKIGLINEKELDEIIDVQERIRKGQIKKY